MTKHLHKQTVSIYLVDDHMIFRQSFEAFLSTQESFRCLSSGNGSARCLQEILHLNPDIVLLDFHLERENGIDLLQKLRDAHFPGKIVFLTMNRDKHIRDAARSFGANGFVSKEADGYGLLSGLLSLAKGQIEYLEMTTEVSGSDANPYHLTKQELTIARLICSGLSSEKVAEQLFISIHTVHTHRRRILEKTASENFLEVCRKMS